MLTSILIIVTSSMLFVYWFRYTCLLILDQNQTSRDALKVASTIRLSFPEAEQTLQAEPARPALDRLHQSLENDYRTLTDLLRQATGSSSIEHRILEIDYKIMRVWYRLARASNPVQARGALAEMSSILGYFAAEIGQT